MRLDHLHKCAEKAARLRAVGDRVLLSLKKFAGKGLEIRVILIACRAAIRSDQAVVDKNFDVVAVELKFSIESRLGFQSRTGVQRSARGLRQAILILPVHRSL